MPVFPFRGYLAIDDVCVELFGHDLPRKRFVTQPVIPLLCPDGNLYLPSALPLQQGMPLLFRKLNLSITANEGTLPALPPQADFDALR